MKERRFKVGDRVYIKEGFSHGHGGEYGLIIREGDSFYDWVVKTPTSNGTCFYNHELELDKPSIVQEIIRDL